MYDRVRSDSNSLAAKLIIYELIINIVPLLALTAYGSVNGQTDNSVLAAMQIIGCVSGLIFILALDRCRLRTYFESGRKMTANAFIRCFLLILTLQGVFKLLFFGLEVMANRLGYSLVTKGLEVLSDGSPIMSMYAVLIGPVSEELVFRRYVILSAKKYGTTFAIVISSLLFALFHGNLEQGLNTFMLGLVLGYIAVEYSVGWAILMHIVNNSLAMIELAVGEGAVAVLQPVCYCIATVVTVWYAVSRFKRIKGKIAAGRTRKGVYRAYLSSFFMLILIGIGLLSCVRQINRI
jgi:hypothetical protein